MANYFLIIKQDELTAAKVVNGLITDLEKLYCTQKALQEWLNKFAVQSISIVVELSEEELFIDKHPGLYPWELNDYAKRQVARRFPATEFSTHRFLTPVSVPWKVVEGDFWISGFNDDEVLRNLVHWLVSAEVAVLSIHSSMSLWSRFLEQTWFASRVKKREFAQSALVLLIRIDQQDFRQYLLVNGQVRISRHIHLDINNLVDQHQLLLQEVNLLEKFARSQKWMKQEVSLSTFFVGGSFEDRQAALKLFAKSATNSHLLDPQFIDMQSIVSAIDEQEFYDRMMLQLLQNASGKGDYKPRVVQQVQSIRQAKVSLWASVVLLVLLVLGYLSSSFTDRLETEKALQRLQSIKESNQSVISRFVGYDEIPYLKDYALTDMKQAMEAQDAIRRLQQDQSLSRLLVPVSQVLNIYPEVQLLNMMILTQSRQIDERSQVKTGSNHSSSGRFNTLVLSLSMQVNANARLADKIEQLEQLLADFSRVNPAIISKAVLSKSPFSVSSDHPLKFSLDDSLKKEVMSVPFEVTLQVAYE